jgi:excisionase family DNA binding protein
MVSDAGPPKQLAITIEQLCYVLQIGRTSAHALISSGALSSFKIGRSRRVLLADVEQMIAERIG